MLPWILFVSSHLTKVSKEDFRAGKIDVDKLDQIDDSKEDIPELVKKINEKELENEFYNCMFMVPKLTFLATPQEIAEARKTFVNKELNFPSYDYLKTHERKFGAKSAVLFTAVWNDVMIVWICVLHIHLVEKQWKQNLHD